MSKKNRTRFTQEEDDMIISFVERNGLKFEELSHLFPHRTPKQIRERYSRFLKPWVDRTELTIEESQLLFDSVRLIGRRFALISKKYFPKRNPKQLQNQFDKLTRQSSVQKSKRRPQKSIFSDTSPLRVHSQFQQHQELSNTPEIQINDNKSNGAANDSNHKLDQANFDFFDLHNSFDWLDKD